METITAVQIGRNGKAQITAPELRKMIESAGIVIEYRRDKVVTREPGERAKAWAPTCNDPPRELVLLHRIAAAYHIPVMA